MALLSHYIVGISMRAKGYELFERNYAFCAGLVHRGGSLRALKMQIEIQFLK
jgi:hypothetical protein